MSDMRRGSAVARDHGDNRDIMTKQFSRSEPEGWVDGFRRAEKLPRRFQHSPYKQTLPPVIAGSRDYDLGAANIKTANTLLARELKGRHLQMIAFGGAIGKRQIEGGICSLMLIAPVGTGLFVASGNSLSTGGPASLFLSFFIHGVLQYSTMQSLGELCVLFPIAGSFSAFSTRFLDPSWGFAMGWK